MVKHCANLKNCESSLEQAGGGFYQMIKFMVAQSTMPDELAWFKWEAYTTRLLDGSTGVLVFNGVVTIRRRPRRQRAL